jgi:hypothetical protein
MTTATATPPPGSKLQHAKSAGSSQLLTTPSLQTTARSEAAAGERPYWGDWVAMVFWTACFALMGVIHLKDLLVSFFR